MTNPRIAVVGAGLGGLALARVLQLHNRQVTVFEREPSAEARGQGGSLDMHVDSGQHALKVAELFDEFSALARPESDEWLVRDHRTAELRDETVPGDDEPRPEIDRGQLRGLYLDALAPGTVYWGRSVSGVTSVGDGRSELLFEDGSAETFDLVVGADGAWSRIRPALSSGEPEYTGVTFVEVGFDDADRRYPSLAQLVGNGNMIAKSPGRAVFGQRNSNSHIRAYLALRVPEGWHGTLDFTDTAAIRAVLLDAFAGWHEDMLDIVRTAESFIPRSIRALPVPHVWPHTPGVTLVGDAAHLMPPLGVGANLAMLDGTELAMALATASTVDEAVRAYEEVMLPRSAEIAKECVEGLAHLLP